MEGHIQQIFFFFFFFSEKGPSPRALAARLTALEEGEHFQLSKTCCEFLTGAREGNAWYTEALGKSSQGKQVVRTRLDKHKAWK